MENKNEMVVANITKNTGKAKKIGIGVGVGLGVLGIGYGVLRLIERFTGYESNDTIDTTFTDDDDDEN